MLIRKKQKWLAILLKEDPLLEGQDKPYQTWTPLTKLKNPIRRSPCINEIIFDVDTEKENDWKSCYKLGKNLEKVFEALEIPFLRFFSGNRLHYHVFLDRKIIGNWLSEIRMHINNESLREFLKNIRAGIFDCICEKVSPVKGAYFDDAIMKSRHLIRVVGSQNEKTGYYKSLLFELPEEQPKITEEKVIFPKKIVYWKIPEELLYYVYGKIMEKEKLLEAEGKKSTPSYKEKSKIEWVEKLLQTPLEDGRKRAINLILAPYFMNVLKVDEQTALAKIMEWLRKCDEIRPTKINQNYVLYQMKYAKKRKLKVLSRKNLEEYFPDVPKIKELEG